MKIELAKVCFLLFGVLINLSCVQAQLKQSSGNQTTEPLGIAEKKLNIGDLHTDFDVLINALKETHGGLYRFSSPQSLENRFITYRQQLDKINTQRDFIALLSKMLAEVRDGHLRLEYDEVTSAALTKARLFPFRVLLENNKLMVVYNETPQDSIISPGMELLSINGHSVNDLLKMILPNLPGDGFIETGKRRRLGRSFGQNYWLFVDQSSEFVISAKDVKGKIVTTKLQGVLNIERENNRNNNPVNAKMLAILPQIETAKKNISLHFIDGFEIAKLRILYFDGASFNATLDTVFQSLHDHKTKSLILDLRGNPGGVDTYGAWLVAHFTNQPFRYFDRIHITTVLPSFSTWKPGTSENLRNGVIPDSIRGGFLVTTKLHEGVGLQNPASQPFLGKVIVLMDGGTFSTATDVTAILSQLTTATFVGEESGGTYEGNTSGLNALIKLPNSKLGLKINMYGYWNAVSGGQKGRGTMPDHPVVLRTNDLLEGFDLQWDKALSLAKQNSIKK